MQKTNSYICLVTKDKLNKGGNTPTWNCCAFYSGKVTKIKTDCLTKTLDFMEDTIKIKASKSVAKFLDKVLADKRRRKEESRRKFKNGELKISN